MNAEDSEVAIGRADELGGDANERARRVKARAMQRAKEDLLASEHERIEAGLATSAIGENELARAREQVGKWVRGEICSPRYSSRWAEILDGPPVTVAGRLRNLDEIERRALFQNTPFGFLLSDRVRG